MWLWNLGFEMIRTYQEISAAKFYHFLLKVWIEWPCFKKVSPPGYLSFSTLVRANLLWRDIMRFLQILTIKCFPTHCEESTKGLPHHVLEMTEILTSGQSHGLNEKKYLSVKNIFFIFPFIPQHLFIWAYTNVYMSFNHSFFLLHMCIYKCIQMHISIFLFFASAMHTVVSWCNIILIPHDFLSINNTRPLNVELHNHFQSCSLSLELCSCCSSFRCELCLSQWYFSVTRKST